MCLCTFKAEVVFTEDFQQIIWDMDVQFLKYFPSFWHIKDLSLYLGNIPTVKDANMNFKWIGKN